MRPQTTSWLQMVSRSLGAIILIYLLTLGYHNYTNGYPLFSYHTFPNELLYIYLLLWISFVTIRTLQIYKGDQTPISSYYAKPHLMILGPAIFFFLLGIWVYLWPEAPVDTRQSVGSAFAIVSAIAMGISMIITKYGSK